jgi:molybdopterin-guanine dinucleotide biosynthesis protein A
MGRDKAALRVASGNGDSTAMVTLAERTASLLAGVTDVALEVGPGFTQLDRVLEGQEKNGPLSAFAAGAAELGRLGWHGPVLLVATDLPRLSSAMLGWLAAHAPGRSVVPVAGGRPQPLCARYEAGDVATASRLVAEGKRSMTALLEACNPLLAPEETWLPAAGDTATLDDVDTPDQLDDYVGRLP